MVRVANGPVHFHDDADIPFFMLSIFKATDMSVQLSLLSAERDTSLGPTPVTNKVATRYFWPSRLDERVALHDAQSLSVCTTNSPAHSWYSYTWAECGRPLICGHALFTNISCASRATASRHRLSSESGMSSLVLATASKDFAFTICGEPLSIFFNMLEAMAQQQLLQQQKQWQRKGQLGYWKHRDGRHARPAHASDATATAAATGRTTHAAPDHS